MRADLRDSVRERYAYQCGYCGVREVDAGAMLTIDHFRPRTQGGTDDIDNLVYCCHACNEFKGDYWQPASTQRILHPLMDDVGVHVQEGEDHVLTATTDTGVFHIGRLRLNRAELVTHRRLRSRVHAAHGALPSLEARLGQLEEQVRNLLNQLARPET